MSDSWTSGASTQERGAREGIRSPWPVGGHPGLWEWVVFPQVVKSKDACASALRDLNHVEKESIWEACSVPFLRATWAAEHPDRRGARGVFVGRMWFVGLGAVST